jgi:hypothetical protein
MTMPTLAETSVPAPALFRSTQPLRYSTTLFASITMAWPLGIDTVAFCLRQ